MRKISIPKRRLLKVDSDKNSVWEYVDPEEHAVALKAQIAWAFNLGEFDTWLEGLEACEAKNELIERRNNLFSESKKVLKGSLEFLKIRRFEIEKENHLLPLALYGNTIKAKRAVGGKNSRLIRLKKAEELSRLIASLYNQMKINAELKDIPCYHSHVIDEFQKKYPKEKKISSYLINKAIKPKKPSHK